MVDMKVSEAERGHLIFTRLLRTSMRAHRWVRWLAVRFGTELYVDAGNRRLRVRQFFGEQYLISR